MDIRAHEASKALTDKEKQTLRLIVRGHDAKSVARTLGLSVHTINERLRDARRKMAVSSSREAARLLLESETGGAGPPTPESVGDTAIGEDAGPVPADRTAAPVGGAGLAYRQSLTIIGVLLMTVLLGLLALTAQPPAISVPPQAPVAGSATSTAAVVDQAIRFLTLVDQGNWDESYRVTGSAFRKLNTAQIWADVSQKVRVPLGAVISRTFVSQEDVPAPPAGYEVVKFRTRFANRAETIETVSLEREAGEWRVVGVTIG